MRPQACAVASLPLLLAVAAIGLLTSSLAAQREPGGVRLNTVTGEVGVEGEVRDEKAANTNGQELDETEWLLREIAGTRLRGDVYHPALFEFDAGIKLVFEQREVEGGSRPRQLSSDDSLFYDLRGLAFKEKDINGDAYAWRSRSETRQRFFATSQAYSDEWGANLRLRNLWIPSQLHYDQYSYSGRGLDTLRERRERMRVSGNRVADWTSVDYSVEHNDVEQLSFAKAYRELIARGSVSQRFGGEGVHFIRVGGYSRDQTGDIESDLRQATAQLHLQWLESLWTEHGVNVEQSQFGSALSGRRDNLEYNSTIQHRLYQSLDTGVTGRLIQTDLGVAEVDRKQLEGDLRYRKETVFGSLGAAYRPVWYEQDERNADELVPILGESHVVGAGVPIFLANFGVVLGSIVVTDDLRSVTYAEPLDYRVSTLDGRTRLDIPIGSRILPGATILVDYVFEARPDKRFRSMRHDVRLQFGFGHWGSLEFAYGDEQQDLLSGIDDGSLGNNRYRAVYARVFGGGQELAAEYEDWDTAFAPYERSQLRATSTLEFDADKRLLTQGTLYRTRFKGLPEDEHGASLSCTFDWQVGIPTRLFSRAEYHAVDYRTDSGSGWLGEVGLQYHVRNLEVLFDVRYTSERFEVATDQDLLYAHFSVRRFF